MATAALALAGCGDPGEVQIQSFGGTIWSSPLGADYLTRPQNLGISSHEAPPETLTARVDSERTRPELLFFPFDPQITFDVIQDQQNSPLLPTLLSPGFVHPGGLRNYFVGAALYYGNGGVTPRSIQGLYQRIHGECELEVKWESLFKAIAGKLDDYSGEGVCNDLFCPDYDISYNERVLTSYLRQVNVTALGGTGRGGFGLFIKGDAEFDSPVVGDVRFSGNAAYDLVNIAGLPAFRISQELVTLPVAASTLRGVRVRRRRFQVFTCDRGRTWVDVDKDPPERIRKVLQEIVESGFWRELDRFPVDAIARALPALELRRETRRLLEIWIEERGEGGRAA